MLGQHYENGSNRTREAVPNLWEPLQTGMGISTGPSDNDECSCAQRTPTGLIRGDLMRGNRKCKRDSKSGNSVLLLAGSLTSASAAPKQTTPDVFRSLLL